MEVDAWRNPGICTTGMAVSDEVNANGRNDIATICNSGIENQNAQSGHSFSGA